mgnify:CR=1 FL=1
MQFFNIRMILLAALFVALVVKGGELCSAEGVQAMTRLVERDRPPAVEPVPLRPIETEFRGLSPLPELSASVTPSKKLVKSAAAKNSAKPSKAAQSSAKQPSRKPAKKS